MDSLIDYLFSLSYLPFLTYHFLFFISHLPIPFLRQILHTYKLRLTNLSQSNRSLKLGKLSKRRDIDLCQLAHLNGMSADEMLLRLLADKDINLISRPDPRHEPTNKADKRLNHIFREINTLHEEVGSYDLFVGYPFVEGKFLDGTIVRCPVLLFPVRLQRKLGGRPRWKLERLRDEPVQFNKTFCLAYEHYQKIRLPESFWEEEIPPQSDKLAWVNALYEKIKHYELEVNFNARLFDQSLKAFPDYLKATLENFRLGVLSFQPHAVLGIFPQSDSALLQDYETLEESEDINKKGFHALIGNQEPSLPLAPPSTYIREEERYFVTPIDQSQEAALLTVKQGNSTVIHGPPGTGKSQVIVNMIADAMAHGKKVLVVSQKRAALDVVYKRLEGLGLHTFSMLVHDFRYDRKAIYEQIRELIEAIPTFKQEIIDLNVTQWEYSYQILCRQVDQYAKKFEELYQALTHRKEVGMSIHELYLHTDRRNNPLPVESFAQQATIAELQELQDLLPLLAPYKEFFQSIYPWYFRLPLHEADWNYRREMEDKIAAIPKQLRQLHQGYSQLQEDWEGWPITDIQKNQEVISAYELADESLSHPAIRKGIEEILIDPNPYTLEETLSKFEQCLGQLDSCTLLDEGHWRIYGSLRKHIQAYDSQKEQKLRIFSLSFQRARWFLKKLLSASQVELNEVSFSQVKAEGEKFKALHSLFAREHEREFLGDFPLLNTRKEKYEWVEKKKDQLHRGKHIQQLPESDSLHRPRLKMGNIDEQGWAKSRALIQGLKAYTQELENINSQWELFLHPEQHKSIWQGIQQPNNQDAYLRLLLESFQRDGEELQNLDRLIQEASPQVQAVIPTLHSLLAAGKPLQELKQEIQHSVYSYWIIQAERLHPVLGWVSTRSWGEQAQLFQDKLSESRKRVSELVLRRIKERIVQRIEYNRLKNPVTYRDILHQVSKKRRIWSVRKLIRETWEEGLQELVPCWMASPESASAIFPMKEGFFDLVIFDEASQCFVERAIPVALRGKQVVVAGDDKQLQPLNLYQVRYEEEETEFVEDEVALEVESILDLAKTRLNQHPLTWHYRSQDAALINFSNQAFYGGSLQVFPSAKKDTRYLPALEWMEVDGRWRSNRNVEEGERIIRLVLELIQQTDKPTLGIVTFNFHQQELIKDLLEEKLAELLVSDKDQYARLQEALNRREQGEFQGLFVKNIENVQGDERDIIIFSIGYAHNLAGKMNTHFGLLNQSGGENRLNVAITRARKKIYVVCSFHPDELRVSESLHDGPKLFKSYLQYVKERGERREEWPPNPLEGGGSSGAKGERREEREERAPYINPDTRDNEKNPITEYLAEGLRQAGYHVETEIGDTGYKIDLAIKNKATDPSYLLGIECEGPYYFRGASAREREIYRPEGLRQRGWQIHRVWARNFWWDRERELEKVLERLERLNEKG